MSNAFLKHSGWVSLGLCFLFFLPDSKLLFRTNFFIIYLSAVWQAIYYSSIARYFIPWNLSLISCEIDLGSLAHHTHDYHVDILFMFLNLCILYWPDTHSILQHNYADAQMQNYTYLHHMLHAYLHLDIPNQSEVVDENAWTYSTFAKI